MLNDTQERFITRYVNNNGDAYKALDSLGLEMNHLHVWRRDLQFDRAYRKTQQQVIRQINQDNYMIGLRKLNHILTNGVFQVTTTYKKEEGGEHGDKMTTTRVEKQLGVPMEALRLALQNGSIIQAINTLQNQGMLPDEMANQIMVTADQIVGDLQKALDKAEEDELKMDEDRVVGMFKTAVLGAISQ